jgi:CHAD domain-containing protein
MVVERQSERFPEVLLLREQLERHEGRALQIASRQVREFRTRKLEKWIRGLVANLSERESDARGKDQLAAVALRCAREAFEETVRRRRLVDFSDLRTIHRTRVAFKKFRYIVESLPPQVTDLSKRELRRLAWYQRRMGNIQDLEVVQACVVEFLQRHEGAEPLLKPFSAFLRHLRVRALRTFVKSADALLEFWPPPRLVAPRNAATLPTGVGFAL